MCRTRKRNVEHFTKCVQYANYPIIGIIAVLIEYLLFGIIVRVYTPKNTLDYVL